MAIDDITCGAAAVVPVQSGGTLQADGQVAGLTEKPELLSRVQGAEYGSAEATASLQLLQSLNRMRRCSLLPPTGQRTDTEKSMSVSQSLQSRIEYNRKFYCN